MSSQQFWLLLLALALVLVAGLLVAAETAISRVSRSALEEFEDERPSARLLLQMLEDRSRYVNVLLFLSTVLTVTATALVTVDLAAWLTGSLEWPLAASLATTVAVMVVVSYVALGVAPRTLGRQHAERIALRSARAARALATILAPITALLIVIGNALTPGKGYREGPFASEAELREFVDMAEAERLIEDDERQMIHSVFELGDTYAREVMVPRTEMVLIERHRSLRQAMSLGLRSGFSRIPVIGENADDIVGIVYLKDVFRRSFEHRDAEQDERVESLMRAPTFVPDSKPADDLLRDMQAARVHLAIVVDEYGGTAGLVTIEDILEEIVGEIADEYDTAAPEIAEIADGVYRISARLHVDDLSRLIEADLDAEEEGVDTVLGLMAKRLGRVPINGAEVRIDGHLLTAEEGIGRRHRIVTVRVEPVSDGAD